MSSGRLHPLVMAVSTCLSVKALQTQIYIIAPLVANDYQKHLITASIFLCLRFKYVHNRVQKNLTLEF
jgi:hypothetical protein